MNAHMERAESADVVDDLFDFGPTFDDVSTGEVAVRQLRVKATPDTPAPVGFGEVAEFTWRVPSVLPRRHSKGDVLPWLAVLAGVGSGVFLVGAVAAVLGGVL